MDETSPLYDIQRGEDIWTWGGKLTWFSDFELYASEWFFCPYSSALAKPFPKFGFGFSILAEQALWAPLGWDGLALVAPTSGCSPRGDRRRHRKWFWLSPGQLHDDPRSVSIKVGDYPKWGVVVA